MMSTKPTDIKKTEKKSVQVNGSPPDIVRITYLHIQLIICQNV